MIDELVRIVVYERSVSINWLVPKAQVLLFDENEIQEA